MDQGGGSEFAGELGRVSVFSEALPEAEIQALARSDHNLLTGKPRMLRCGEQFSRLGFLARPQR
jgi:hypothetical protein